MATLLLLLKNRWVQYGLAAAAVILMLLAVRQHYINTGKEAGRAEGKQQTKDVIEQARASDREQTARVMAEYDRAAALATARAETAERNAATFAALAGALAKQREAATASVTRLPDAELHGYNVRAIALRSAGDNTPGYYPNEERVIANCVTDQPFAQKQNDAISQELTETRKQVTALGDKVQALDGRFAALAGYTVRLESSYTQLFNLTPKRVKSPRCLWLWACRKQILPVPEPAQLLGSRPQ